MSCTHPRQAVANNKTRAMPCAWPDCPDGLRSTAKPTMTIVLFGPPLGFSFSDTIKPLDPAPITKVEYERVKLFDFHADEYWYEWQIKA